MSTENSSTSTSHLFMLQLCDFTIALHHYALQLCGLNIIQDRRIFDKMVFNRSHALTSSLLIFVMENTVFPNENPAMLCEH